MPRPSGGWARHYCRRCRARTTDPSRLPDGRHTCRRTLRTPSRSGTAGRGDRRRRGRRRSRTPPARRDRRRRRGRPVARHRRTVRRRSSCRRRGAAFTPAGPGPGARVGGCLGHRPAQGERQDRGEDRDEPDPPRRRQPTRRAGVVVRRWLSTHVVPVLSIARPPTGNGGDTRPPVSQAAGSREWPRPQQARHRPPRHHGATAPRRRASRPW